MNWNLIVLFELVGLCIGLFLAFSYVKKWKAIKHYEKLRDELSVRKPKEKKKKAKLPEPPETPKFIKLIIQVVLMGVMLFIFANISGEVMDSACGGGSYNTTSVSPMCDSMDGAIELATGGIFLMGSIGVLLTLVSIMKGDPEDYEEDEDEEGEG